MYTYRYAKRMLRIDYIFHSPSLKVLHTTLQTWICAATTIQ